MPLAFNPGIYCFLCIITPSEPVSAPSGEAFEFLTRIVLPLLSNEYNSPP